MAFEKKKIPQPMLPRGIFGWIMAWLMPLGHKPIYKLVSVALDLQPEDDLLEVACGGGYFLKKYASHVHSVAGLDLSEVQIKMAKRKLRKRITAGTAEIVHGEASKLPWENNRFSVATSMGSFIAFPQPLDSLKEMHRVLCPGGRAVLSIEWNAEDGLDHSKKVKQYGMLVLTEDDVRDLMEEAGFSNISFTYTKCSGMPKMMLAHGMKQCQIPTSGW